MKLQPLTLDQQTAWAELLSICFEQPQDHMESVLCWMHRLGDFTAYGIWDNNKLIAQYTCLTRPITHQYQQHQVGMSMNMAVHPDYRGQGLIKHISRPVYESLTEHNVAFGMGFSNADGVKVDRRSKSYGYNVVGQMQPHLARTLSAKASPVYLTDKFPKTPLTLSSECSPSTQFVKDWTYFNQRYAQHPFRNYHYGVWQEDNLNLGFVVYRPVKLWGIQAVALLDILSENPKDLLHHWSHTLRANNIHLVHTLTSPISTLKQSLRSNHQLIKLPITRNPYYLTVKPLQDCTKNILNLKKWDLVGGDIL